MMRRCAFLYFVALTIPLLLGLLAWQSARYRDLEKAVARLEDSREDWVESNRRLIAGNAILSSSERIEHIAVEELGFAKIAPEHVLQIRIEEQKGNDG
jgi:cell division protein FtsL